MPFVKYNAKNVYSCLDVKLLPGINEVEDARLKSVLKEPFFKARVESGIIEIIETKKSDRKGDRKLLELMPHVYDVKLLKKYISESEDQNIVESAKKQLKKIEDVEVKEEVEVGITIK